MYYLFERSWGNVHKDFECHTLCLSVLGNKYIVYMSHNKRKSQHINMSTQYVRCRSSRSDVKHSSSKLNTCIASWLHLTLSGLHFIPTLPSCSDLGQKSHFMCYASDWSWCWSVLARRSHLKWDLLEITARGYDESEAHELVTSAASPQKNSVPWCVCVCFCRFHQCIFVLIYSCLVSP